LDEQKAAVECGHWPLFRFNPSLLAEGKNPLILDSRPPKVRFEEFAYRENRFNMLTKMKPDWAKELLKKAQDDVNLKWKIYETMKNQYDAILGITE